MSPTLLLPILLSILILLPFVSGAACYVFRRPSGLRFVTVPATGMMLTAAAILLFSQAPFSFRLEDTPLFKEKGIDTDIPIYGGIAFLLMAQFYIGWIRKHWPIVAVTLFQGGLFGMFVGSYVRHDSMHPVIFCDTLSLLMTLVVSIIGPLVGLYALSYLKKREKKYKIETSKRPVFFALLLVILGAVNGLILTNDWLHCYFFFEVLTLSFYVLIAHDGTDKARQAGVKALWANSAGGALMLLAIFFLHNGIGGSLSMQQVITTTPAMGILLIPMFLLYLGTFIKSGQLPFKGWVVEAAEAPMPVMTLLHASVIGVSGGYLALRLAPAVSGSFLSMSVTFYAAFVFLASAVLAVSCRELKYILTYSTVGTIALIYVCAGLGLPETVATGIFLVIFHALAKTLILMCYGNMRLMGDVERLEHMRRLYDTLPVTTLSLIVGILALTIPPFTVMLTQWVLLGLTLTTWPSILMVGFGGILTLLYWARWARVLVGSDTKGRTHPERMAAFEQGPLLILGLSAAVFALLAPWIYAELIVPILDLRDFPTHLVEKGLVQTPHALYIVGPLLVLAMAGVFLAVKGVVFSGAAADPAASLRVMAREQEGGRLPRWRRLVGRGYRLLEGRYIRLKRLDTAKTSCRAALGATMILVFILGGMVHLIHMLGGGL